MKFLGIKTLGILKFLLLFNLIIGIGEAQIVSSDRYLLKISDHAISLQDMTYQVRNLKALNCIYSDAIVLDFFEIKFVSDLEQFIKNFPEKSEQGTEYLHQHEALLKKIRYFFKMLKYAQEQKPQISKNLEQIVRESAKVNNCSNTIIHKDSLKTNFKNLLEMELYFRARYAGQMKSSEKSETIKSSIDLLIDSLDKQFSHEYYW